MGSFVVVARLMTVTLCVKLVMTLEVEEVVIELVMKWYTEHLSPFVSSTVPVFALWWLTTCRAFK